MVSFMFVDRELLVCIVVLDLADLVMLLMRFNRRQGIAEKSELLMWGFYSEFSSRNPIVDTYHCRSSLCC